MAWIRRLFEPKARPPTQPSTGPSQSTEQPAAAQRRKGTASPQGSSSPTRTTPPKSPSRSSPSRKARSPPAQSPSRLAPPPTTLAEDAPPLGGESSAKVHPTPDVVGIPPPPSSPTTRGPPFLGVDSSEKVHSAPESPSPSRPSSRPPTPPRSSPSRKPRSPPQSPSRLTPPPTTLAGDAPPLGGESSAKVHSALEAVGIPPPPLTTQTLVSVPDGEVKASQTAVHETISKEKERIQPPDTTIPPSIVSQKTAGALTDTAQAKQPSNNQESDGLSVGSSHRAAPETVSELQQTPEKTLPPLIVSEKSTASLTERHQETAPPPPTSDTTMGNNNRESLGIFMVSNVLRDKETLPETGGDDRNHIEAKHEMAEEQTAKKQPESKEPQEEAGHTEKASNSDGPETREVNNGKQENDKKLKQQVFIQKTDKREMQSSMEYVLGAVKVITLAGDNKGASMQLGFDPSSKKERPIHIHRAYKSNHGDHRIVDKEAIITTDIEEAGRKSNSQETNQEQEVLAVYVNSNVQGLNNAILVDCTITERNPGVSMHIPSCLQTEPVNSNDETAPIRTHEAVQLKKLAHEAQPTLRRRCLRGLLLESDSETDSNPSKRPRRHGCRVGCKDK
ncbi:unnamed protein product [Cuscuta europaea]|uniref:Uncharacterized protein n=1 Tax=Cuscuta europaea TaxID=41803 RepID=A0A9P1E4C7_CUSEU|nr:unnamed protein product [Cuscuta europaea]